MPALDGTGPQGAGPMTGRGMGYCGRNSQGRFYNPAPGFRGVGGLGAGGGRLAGRPERTKEAILEGHGLWPETCSLTRAS